MTYKAEYIWIDGTEPSARLRSKTRILADGAELPEWGFDGSSTNQAPGDNSDCVLKPVFSCPDPIRGGDHKLVLCEVYLVDGTPHPTNNRAKLLPIAEQFAEQESWFGIEQEYTFFQEGRPLGFPAVGFPAPQGPYYCGVGADEVFGREIVEKHLDACIDAGLKISGINAEVMPGQWEFQIGPAGVTEVGDHLNVARWLLQRIAEDYDVVITFAAKPQKGDWNGAGCHTNFSSKTMRESYPAVIAAVNAVAKNYLTLVKNYGHDIESRLTGAHETAPWDKFSYGVSDRGASIRIPLQVSRDGKGYLEDRRPNANCDPYVVARLLTETVCGSDASGNGVRKSPAKKVAAKKVAAKK